MHLSGFGRDEKQRLAMERLQKNQMFLIQGVYSGCAHYKI